MAEVTHDLLALLRDDHERVQELLRKMASNHGDDRLSLLHHLDRALRIHGEAEEELVYPVYKDCVERHDVAVQVEQHRAEHTLAKDLLDDLLISDVDSAAFEGRLRLLKKAVTEHAEQEEAVMFPALQEGCSQEVLADMARAVAERKQALMNRFG